MCDKLTAVHYQGHSSQFKETVLNKLSQNGLFVWKFAEQKGINPSALYSLQRQFNVSGLNASKVSSSDKWSREEKFAIVLEILIFTEVKWDCRTKRLYPEQNKDRKRIEE